jgi:hypothetical protein
MQVRRAFANHSVEVPNQPGVPTDFWTRRAGVAPALLCFKIRCAFRCAFRHTVWVFAQRILNNDRSHI